MNRHEILVLADKMGIRGKECNIIREMYDKFKDDETLNYIQEITHCDYDLAAEIFEAVNETKPLPSEPISREEYDKLCKDLKITHRDIDDIETYLRCSRRKEALRSARISAGHIKTGEKILNYLVKNNPDLNEQQQSFQHALYVRATSVPKCPICGSTNLSKITITTKAVKTVAFGIAGAMSDAGKTYKCNNCSSKF